MQDIVEDGQVERHRLIATPSGACVGLDAVVLNEDEEGVLHLPGRELEAADDLLQRQRTVAQKAATHFGYDGAEVVGDDVNGEEDAVLRHHGGAPAATREDWVWVRDAVADGGLAAPINPRRGEDRWDGNLPRLK